MRMTVSLENGLGLSGDWCMRDTPTVDTLNMKIKACNALNAMFVETVNTLVFVALTQHLIQSNMMCENSTLFCIKWPLTPARREGYLLQYSI